MDLASLAVFHLSKKDLSPLPSLSFKSQESVFFLETCQRFLWIGDLCSPFFSELKSSLAFQKGQFYEGVHAYRLLLRFAAGLESQLLGETEVFGQLKEAWSELLKTDVEVCRQLRPWLQRLFEDVKEIRSLHLQDLGSLSYGGRIRRILQHLEKNCESMSPIGIIGAGQIAQSVVPWLSKYELWIWNRTLKNLNLFSQTLGNRLPANVVWMTEEDDEKKIWTQSRHVIVCIPEDPLKDKQRMEWWKENPNRGWILHLGISKASTSGWNEMQAYGLHALEHVYEQKEDEFRLARLHQAQKACGEKAQLRALGVSTVHSWEDLAFFQGVF